MARGNWWCVLELKRFVAAGAACLVLGGVAQAQTAASEPSRGYAEAVIQAAFGNVTSQSFGGEFGVRIYDQVQLFVEAGRTRDVAAPEIGAEAQQVAGALAQTNANVEYQVRQPATFGVAGIRYVIPMEGRAMPYVLGAFGVAEVKQDVTFSIGGSDVTSSLAQYGVVLGSRLSGSSTKPMLVFGGGVQVPLWQRLVVDLQYRYGRIFTEDVGTNVNRAGIGVGVRF